MEGRRKQDTFLAQIGNRRDEHHRAVSTPIYFSTAYRHEKIGLNDGYDYSRSGNPTRDVLEEAVAELEGGYGAFATSSGMAAVQLTLDRKSTRLNSSHVAISYAVFCLKKKIATPANQYSGYGDTKKCIH